jgi:putative ABC transport system ATP-binding protein
MTLPGPGQIDVGALWAGRMVRARTRLRARHIGVIASHGGMFPAVSIRRNAHYRAHLAGVPGRLVAERVQAIAERLEISSYLDLRADQLSRGQALRGAILQGLVHLPELIIADEPTASLHPALAGRLFSALGQMAADQKGAAIVATHDAATANAAGFRLLRAVPSGDPAHQMTEFRWAEAREV